jgi:hypothetical protein
MDFPIDFNEKIDYRIHLGEPHPKKNGLEGIFLNRIFYFSLVLFFILFHQLHPFKSIKLNLNRSNTGG